MPPEKINAETENKDYEAACKQLDGLYKKVEKLEREKYGLECEVTALYNVIEALAGELKR